jgi:hypothetical protein
VLGFAVNASVTAARSNSGAAAGSSREANVRELFLNSSLGHEAEARPLRSLSSIDKSAGSGL